MHADYCAATRFFFHQQQCYTIMKCSVRLDCCGFWLREWVVVGQLATNEMSFFTTSNKKNFFWAYLLTCSPRFRIQLFTLVGLDSKEEHFSLQSSCLPVRFVSKKSDHRTKLMFIRIWFICLSFLAFLVVSIASIVNFLHKHDHHD